jgi:D-alanine-D-alanine ligase
MRAGFLEGTRVGVLYSTRLQMARGLARDALSEEDTLRTVAAARSALRAMRAHVVDLGLGADPRPVLERVVRRPPDVVLNLCDAPLGDSALEPSLPAFLDVLGVPYTGAPPLALGLCRDKPAVKGLLVAARVPTPPFAVLAPGKRAAPWRRFPAIVKPASEDASCGIDSASVVSSPAALRRRIAFVHRRYRQAALVERFVAGRELNVSLVGGERPEVLPFGEIDFSDMPSGLPRIVGFEAKWREDRPEYRGTRPIAARPLPRGVRPAMRDAALAAWRLTGCRDYARVDFRLDARGRPFVLEVNANPDLGPDAGLARAWRRAGGEWPGLLATLLGLALRRRPRRA